LKNINPFVYGSARSVVFTIQDFERAVKIPTGNAPNPSWHCANNFAGHAWTVWQFLASAQFEVQLWVPRFLVKT